MEKNMIKVLFICHGKVSPMRQRTSIYNGFSHLVRWISYTFPRIMSHWHGTDDFPLTAVGGIFCISDEPKSKLAWDLGDRLQSQNVPLGTSDDLWEIEGGQKWPGSDFRNIKEISGHFPYSSWKNIVDYIMNTFSGYNTVRNLLCNLVKYELLKCSWSNCKTINEKDKKTSIILKQYK